MFRLLQIPLALLTYALSDSVSLTARVAALSALHIIRSDHEAKTTRQLEKYTEMCAYERTLLTLMQGCMVAVKASAADLPIAQFESPPADLLRCVDLGETARMPCQALTVVCCFACSDVTLYLASASCSVATMERLGHMDAAELLAPLLRACEASRLSSNHSAGLSDATLNLLLVLLNMSSVIDNQPLVCKACLPEIVACSADHQPPKVKVSRRSRCDYGQLSPVKPMVLPDSPGRGDEGPGKLVQASSQPHTAVQD